PIELEHPREVLEMRTDPIHDPFGISNKIVVEPDDLSGCGGVGHDASPIRRIAAEVGRRIELCVTEDPTPLPIPDRRITVAFRKFVDRRSIQLMHAPEQGQLKNAGISDYLSHMSGDHRSILSAVLLTRTIVERSNVVFFTVDAVYEIERR